MVVYARFRWTMLEMVAGLVSHFLEMSVILHPALCSRIESRIMSVVTMADGACSFRWNEDAGANGTDVSSFMCFSNSQRIDCIVSLMFI